MSDETEQDKDTLLEQMAAPSRGSVTTRDTSGLPEGRLSGWELTRMHGQGYYSPAHVPDEPLPHQQEHAQAVAQSRRLAAGVLTRLFANEYRQAGLSVPRAFETPGRRKGLLGLLRGLGLSGNRGRALTINLRLPLPFGRQRDGQT